jgi:hypothetical protein
LLFNVLNAATRSDTTVAVCCCPQQVPLHDTPFDCL